MRYLGIDYGTKRVGIAISDEAGTMGFPFAVLANAKNLAEEISRIVNAEKVEVIVIGSSIDNKGAPNAVETSITAFIKELVLETSAKIVREPEYYSTKEAERTQGRTKGTDASAAAIILSSYLQKRSL